MAKRKIYILNPYISRDLGGNTLIGYVLEKKYGFEVFYGNGYHVERKIMREKPDAIAFDHLEWNFKAAQLRFAKKQGMKAFVLPTEGLFFDEATVVRTSGGKHDGVTGLVDVQFTWGHFVADTMMKEKVFPPEKVHVVGCPRFDFYAPIFKDFYPTREEFLKKVGVKNPEGPVVLWATNTVYLARDHKKIINAYKKKGSWDTQMIQNVISDEVAQFEEASKMLMYLAEKHPDWNFIIKVHPAEWMRPYEPIAEKYDNVYLEYNVPIKDFLVHCDVLLQRNCTTANEAWILGKPVIQPEGTNYKIKAREEFYTGNHVVRSNEEADQAMQGYISGQPVPEEQQRIRRAFVENYYSKIDGLAFMRAADLIYSNMTGDKLSDERHEAIMNKIAQTEAEHKRSNDAKMINKLKDLFGIDRETSLRFWKTFTKEKRDKRDEGETEPTREQIEALYDTYDKLGVLNFSEEYALNL